MTKKHPYSSHLYALHLLVREIHGNAYRGSLPEYMGITGGDHIYRERDTGRVWAVDLVLQSVTLCVGLLPEQWEHPPRRPA